MFADAMWTFAMAVNVYLVIFQHFDAQDLQRLEKRYLLGCYGLPFIPAFVFLFVNDSVRGRMYANATVSQKKKKEFCCCRDTSADISPALVLDLG
jgi:hypothetical protein